MHRILVLAQGTGWRWNDRRTGRPFKGVPKHFVDIEGERVIDRCIRLFKERDCEVIAIAPSDYKLDAPIVTLDNPFPTGMNLDKLYASSIVWSPTNRTTIVFGDCYYSEEAADKIAYIQESGIHYFRRPWASKITGHKWDETFAVSFTADAHQDVLDTAERVAKEVEIGNIRADHMFNHYAAYIGMDNINDINALFDTPCQTIIDDWTDDFDSPREYQEWLRRRGAK